MSSDRDFLEKIVFERYVIRSYGILTFAAGTFREKTQRVIRHLYMFFVLSVCLVCVSACARLARPARGFLREACAQSGVWLLFGCFCLGCYRVRGTRRDAAPGDTGESHFFVALGA